MDEKNIRFKQLGSYLGLEILGNWLSMYLRSNFHCASFALPSKISSIMHLTGFSAQNHHCALLGLFPISTGASLPNESLSQELLEFKSSLADIARLSIAKIGLQSLSSENMPKQNTFTANLIPQFNQNYTVEPIDTIKLNARKICIDTMLKDIGWQEGSNWISGYIVDSVNQKSEKMLVDYVLFGDNGLPLAIIEITYTTIGIEKGRQRSILYANFFENKYRQRPIIFMTNGYRIYIWDDKHYPERTVSSIYSKRDLEKEFNKMKERTALESVRVNDKISNRYYQKEAIQSVCDAFDKYNRRKALLVMATGSGKTRTVISLVEVLNRHGWVKNILFLADRNALVTQAKRTFHGLMPNLSICNLVEGKTEISARAIFSTYQTMMKCINDDMKNKGEQLFTNGHFDLIIIDEAHRSIYNKYKDIFNYFDALIIGLTATPKDEIDKNTYKIFGLESGVPTYGYELLQAVQDGYLVDFKSIETELKFMTKGISYEELSLEEQERYENTFADEDGNIPETIDSRVLNKWIFNQDTIKKVLNLLMKYGQRIEFGEKIGKSIIFAKNHNHAMEILEVWKQEFSNYPAHYVQVIDNYADGVQNIIDDFSNRYKLPQIAISVDMFDSGIDVPEVLNLVFFKKVMSRSKFRQMIGRGTRTCKKLIDGRDKEQFYVFDMCNNFEFFRIYSKTHEAKIVNTLREQLFIAKVKIVHKLQQPEFQIEGLKSYRKELVQDLVQQINELSHKNFAVKQHMDTIYRYQTEKDFCKLAYEDISQIIKHIAPLILPRNNGNSVSMRFDMLIYQIELAILSGKSYNRAKNDVIHKVSELSKYEIVTATTEQMELVNHIIYDDCLESADIFECENIRKSLRDLINFIAEHERVHYNTNFIDDILSIKWNESRVLNDSLNEYKNKVNYYILKNQSNDAIAKLKRNELLTLDDMNSLENILWNELGTKDQYVMQYGELLLGELVRSIVGLDRKAADEAFSQFLNKADLDSKQRYFVSLTIDYIVKNGMMRDLTVLLESPFADIGSLSEIFYDDIVFGGLLEVIENINCNALEV